MKKYVMVKRILALITLLSVSLLMSACQEKLSYDYGDKEMLVKVWADKTIYNETVVLEDNGSEISGQLLFEPTEIISVRDYTLDKVYDASEYTISGNKIIRNDNTTMPYLTTEQ
jgi:hypothetical protein